LTTATFLLAIAISCCCGALKPDRLLRERMPPVWDITDRASSVT